jgi:hypothetical protein
MIIARHNIIHDHWDEVYSNEVEEFDFFLKGARKDSNNLHMFSLMAKNVYLLGPVLRPNAPEIPQALILAAQATTAIFTTQNQVGIAKPVTLGEGPPVVYDKPASASCADLAVWERAFDLSVITRQSHLCDDLCQIPRSIFEQPAVAALPDSAYRFMDLQRLAWQEERFDRNPLLAECEELARRPRKPAATQAFVQQITIPWLAVLRQLGARDAAGFNDALTNALESHKAYWSSFKSPEPGAHMNGFVSLQLTAAAALAWDRGLRFDVESDYTPTSWVRGDLFR